MSSSDQSSTKKKRDSPGKEPKKCMGRCGEIRESRHFKVYYYQSTRKGVKIGEIEKRRLDICKNCSSKRVKDDDGEIIRKLNKNNLKTQQWLEETGALLNNSSMKGTIGSVKTPERN